MKKNALVIALFSAFIIVAIAVMAPAQTHSPSSSPTPSTAVEANYSGRLVCLPHASQSGVQTMECALGIQDSDGRYYGVKNSQAITQFKVGDAISVTGKLEAPAANETYGVAGNISASKITHL